MEPTEEGEPPALGEGTSPMAVADAFAAAAAAAEEGAALDLTPASIGTPCRPCTPAELPVPSGGALTRVDGGV